MQKIYRGTLDTSLGMCRIPITDCDTANINKKVNAMLKIETIIEVYIMVTLVTYVIVTLWQNWPY